jgi:hypothetical protein
VAIRARISPNPLDGLDEKSEDDDLSGEDDGDDFAAHCLWNLSFSRLKFDITSAPGISGANSVLKCFEYEKSIVMLS